MGAQQRVRFREVFADPAYRRLFVAQTASRAGDAFRTVALVIVVFGLTGSGLGTAGIVVAEILPVLLLAPVAGELVDRLPRRTVMIAADLWRAGLMALLPLVDSSVVAVYAVGFGLSVGSVFFNPAAGSLVPALVPERQLVAANSGIWTAAVLAQIALAPAAGGMVTALGATPAFALDAASFAVSALVLRGLAIPAKPAATGPAGSWAGRVREGLALLVGDRLLRILAAGQLLAALSAGATSALLVVLVERHLHAGAAGFGLLIGAIGIGAAAGPFLLTRLTDNPRRPGFVFGPYLLRGGVDLAVATVTSLPAALGAMAAYGLGTSTGAVTFNSLLQAEVPAQLRGRVFAGMDLLWQSGRLISLAVGGALADTLGIRAVYYLGGALLLLAGGLGLTGLSRSGGSTPQNPR
ncbi:Predicted arabinose efflux permease, MFS family [Modestobacter sp. DSM 44400]|uniref:MFS transporter n=1 Tax=Modestobacter sp. DSM 44400 TaxID=1550230 RepID=UPI00089B8FC8|nr:MFS transporter [Modestobacter sp. DSM 44400]SDY78386.1 Predicted arabinose efflux permease, MFS family [Modestobacter sp. DSM 44400]